MSKVAYNQHTEASLQTAKYKLQCRNAILPKFSLQLGAISSCSERRFCPFPTSVKAMENVRQSLLQKEFQSFYEREKFTANCNCNICSFTFTQSATAHCNHTYYPL